ncbi:MAG: RHS repeat-associated core domain-containing protein [Bacteroidales bacterium]
MQTANTYHIGGQLGEVFLEERNNTWNFAISERRAKFHLDYAECEQNHVNNTPYLFNGKELDEETGLYYYGARYYNPRISLWYGVDPLFDKYPSMSPYNYCANNPVMLVDPDGMTWKDTVASNDLKVSVGKQLTNLEKQRANVQARMNEKIEKGKSTALQERTLASLKRRTTELNQTLEDIDALGDDKIHIYDLMYGDNLGDGKHGVVSGADGIIYIGGSNTGLHIHEIRHVALSLNSPDGLVFNSESKLVPTTATGIYDEIQGYSAQYGYTGSGPAAASTRSGIIKNIANMKDDKDQYVYPHIRTYYLRQIQGLRNYKNYEKSIKKGRTPKIRQVK